MNALIKCWLQSCLAIGLLSVDSTLMAAYETWDATANTVWNTGTANWIGAATTFSAGDNALFSSAAGKGTLTLGQSVTAASLRSNGANTPASTIVTGSAGNILILGTGSPGTGNISDSTGTGGYEQNLTYSLSGANSSLSLAAGSGTAGTPTVWNLASGKTFTVGLASGGAASGQGIDLHGNTVDLTGAGTVILQPQGGYGVLKSTGGTGTFNLNAGILQFASGGSTVATFDSSITVNVAAGATLRLNPNSGTGSVYNETVNLNGGTLATSGNAAPPVQSGPVNLLANSTIDTGSANSVGINIAGVITGSASLTKIGSQPLYLSGTNTFTGDLTVSASSVILTNWGLLNNGNYSGNIIGALSHSGLATQTLAGSISGTGGLAQRGTGKLILTGMDSYSGATTVANGTMEVDGSIASSSAVTVSGGMLGGTGIIARPVAVQVGGTLMAGTDGSMGTLSINNTLTMNSGSTNLMRVNKTGATLTSDLLQGMTSLNYGGATLVVTASGDALASGDTVTLFNASSYSGTFATYDLPPLAGDLSWDLSQLAVNGTIKVIRLPQIFYVAKTGSDANAGTNLSAPFLTIQKAASLMLPGDTCYIRRGTYRETVVPASSGLSNAPILFAAYQGEPVVISGADILNATWNVYSNGIYSAHVPTGFNQLFVDGSMMNEARWPNAQVDNLLNIPRAKVGSGTLTSLTDSALPDVDLTGATLHLFPGTVGKEYEAYTRTITNYNALTKTLYWSNSVSITVNSGNPYYLYGKLDLLDIPTEWYLDATTDNLYLWTPDGASPSKHLVEYRARPYAFVLDNLAYVTVSNLFVFAAGITMNSTTNCVVDDCHLRYIQHYTTADWDWALSQGVTNTCRVSGMGSVWRNSSITVSSQSGLYILGSGVVVSNCVISQVDYYPGNYYASIGLISGGNHKVVGNTLSGSGRFLIMGNALAIEVSSNDMGNGEMLTKDGGGFYTFGFNGTNTRIHHNWVHNTEVGIYLDNGDYNYQVYRNVCYDNEIGIQINAPGPGHLIYNNTLIRNPTSFPNPYGSGGVTNSQVINNLVDGKIGTLPGAFTNKNGWFPPVGSDFVPQAGSGAIDNGQIISGYTDGYLGAGPDIGAYETGGTYWIPGASFSTPPFPTPDSTNVPPAPTGLTVTASAGGLDLAWLPCSVPVSCYNVKRSTTSGGPYTPIANVIVGSYFTDTNIVSGVKYYYVVSAVNSVGESEDSAEASLIGVFDSFNHLSGNIVNGSTLYSSGNSSGIGFAGNYQQNASGPVFWTNDLVVALTNYDRGQGASPAHWSVAAAPGLAGMRSTQTRSTMNLSGTIWFSFIARLDAPNSEVALVINPDNLDGYGDLTASSTGMRIGVGCASTALAGAVGVGPLVVGGDVNTGLNNITNDVNGAVTAKNLVSTNGVAGLVLGCIYSDPASGYQKLDIWYNPDVPNQASLPAPTISFTDTNNVLVPSFVSSIGYQVVRPVNVPTGFIDNVKLSDNANGFSVVYLGNPMPKLNGTNFNSFTFTQVAPVAPEITNVSIVGGNFIAVFSSDADLPVTSFTLQSATNVAGPYIDDDAGVLTGTNGVYQFSVPMISPAKFYRLRY